MLSEGVIRQAVNSANSYLSCVNLVLESCYIAAEKREVKKSRFCVDYRKVNDRLYPSNYPLPIMSEFRRQVAAKGNRIFSNIDCCSFYYQLKLSEQSKHITGFFVLNKYWEFNWLPMGLKNSLGKAQSFMDQVFADHPRAKPFLDDITTFSASPEEYLKDLELTLATCSAYGLLLSP